MFDAKTIVPPARGMSVCHRHSTASLGAHPIYMLAQQDGQSARAACNCHGRACRLAWQSLLWCSQFFFWFKRGRRFLLVLCPLNLIDLLIWSCCEPFLLLLLLLQNSNYNLPLSWLFDCAIFDYMNSTYLSPETCECSWW